MISNARNNCQLSFFGKVFRPIYVVTYEWILSIYNTFLFCNFTFIDSVCVCAYKCVVEFFVGSSWIFASCLADSCFCIWLYRTVSVWLCQCMTVSQCHYSDAAVDTMTVGE